MSFLKSKELKKEILNILSSSLQVYIATPFLKVGDNLFDSVYDLDSIYDCKIIVREDSKNIDIHNLQILGIEFKYIENLHSKIYISEEKAIVTSLNLYDYSFENNIECGSIYYRGTEDYNNILEYYRFLWSKVAKSKDFV